MTILDNSPGTYESKYKDSESSEIHSESHEIHSESHEIHSESHEIRKDLMRLIFESHEIHDLLFAQIQTMTSMTGTSFDMRHPWKVDNRIRNILEGSFFHPLIDMVPYVQKTTFQSFIQDCYDKSSRTFTFGRDRKLKLYLGLQDVFAISGFPVDGSRPIICEDINTKQICIDMLGTYEEEPKMKMKVSKRWLKDTFEAVPEDISEDAIAPYVRGYLLYLIGTKVLPNCDKPTYYPVYWLQFLEDLSPSKLNDVAWGAAAIAMLHTSLGSDRRENVKGPIWIVE
ncbi:serine/threonine-protein phosphatase 7, partial [Tanacetum coccineum]